jgi:hypothetical protein
VGLPENADHAALDVAITVHVRRLQARPACLLPNGDRQKSAFSVTIVFALRPPSPQQRAPLLDALAVANGAHCRKISVAPQQVSQSRRNQNLECSSGAFGGTIEVSGSTLSPEIAISEAAFERDLEREVAAINGAQHNAVLGTEHRQSA